MGKVKGKRENEGVVHVEESLQGHCSEAQIRLGDLLAGDAIDRVGDELLPDRQPVVRLVVIVREPDVDVQEHRFADIQDLSNPSMNWGKRRKDLLVEVVGHDLPEVLLAKDAVKPEDPDLSLVVELHVFGLDVDVLEEGLEAPEDLEGHVSHFYDFGVEEDVVEDVGEERVGEVVAFLVWVFGVLFALFAEQPGDEDGLL